jgi:hypothetical protein
LSFAKKKSQKKERVRIQMSQEGEPKTEEK